MPLFALPHLFRSGRESSATAASHAHACTQAGARTRVSAYTHTRTLRNAPRASAFCHSQWLVTIAAYRSAAVRWQESKPVWEAIYKLGQPNTCGWQAWLGCTIDTTHAHVLRTCIDVYGTCAHAHAGTCALARMYQRTRSSARSRAQGARTHSSMHTCGEYRGCTCTVGRTVSCAHSLHCTAGTSGCRRTRRSTSTGGRAARSGSSESVHRLLATHTIHPPQ